MLLHVLLLSGSEHAATPWEQALMVWLAERDQAVYGLGTVGFDLQKLPWERERLGEQYAFMLTTIDRARGRYRWEELGFDPPFATAARCAMTDTAPVDGIGAGVAPTSESRRACLDTPG